MPNPLSISITGATPNPNDAGATMSRSGTGSPNQATWTSTDKSYNVALPTSTWSVPAGGSLSFTVSQGHTSGVYTLLATAKIGDAIYQITPLAAGEISALTDVVLPKIIVKA